MDIYACNISFDKHGDDHYTLVLLNDIKGIHLLYYCIPVSQRSDH